MKTIKFLYSYGGKIVPRPIDGKLRYADDHTCVLSVDRSIAYSELMVKFGELCGSSMNLKCKLPSDDLDLLVMIKSDEELYAVIEDYESTSSPMAKIRAVLFSVRSAKKASPPSSPMSCLDFPTASKACVSFSPSAEVYCASPPRAVVRWFSYPTLGYPILAEKSRYCQDRSPMHFYHVPHRNYSH
ncbi:hypothetical protein PHJA_002422600 [Phtheirospermum japonicum]|uniref:PB1 domain-containing protein n=1 Tax=Phtheirospermum japonicum TaxID=374723 RepID=A0A830CUG3_9LAMI|nr:hypothetical protein PHJA_002422600 [Phtheirospermum japonicum]